MAKKSKPIIEETSYPSAIFIQDKYARTFLIYEDHPNYATILKEQEENNYVRAELFLEEKWSVKMVDVNTDVIVERMHIGVPGKPDGDFFEYKFPNDPNSLTPAEIETWLFKITAWEGYVIAELGRYESRLSALKDAFELSIFKYADPASKKTVKAIEYEAVTQDPVLLGKKQEIIEKTAIVKRLSAFAEAYKRQKEVLSRSISLRQLEIQMNGARVGV